MAADSSLFPEAEDSPKLTKKTKSDQWKNYHKFAQTDHRHGCAPQDITVSSVHSRFLEITIQANGWENSDPATIDQLATQVDSVLSPHWILLCRKARPYANFMLLYSRESIKHSWLFAQSFFTVWIRMNVVTANVQCLHLQWMWKWSPRSYRHTSAQFNLLAKACVT
jgi:hypothetical protein